MADNTFRSHRGREAPAPERAGKAASGGHDPLAELARLIGQTDPYAERQPSAQGRRPPANEAPEPDQEWADEAEIEQAYAAEGRHAQQAASQPAALHRDYASESGGYERDLPARREYYSGPSGTYGSDQDGADTQNLDEQRRTGNARPVPDFLTRAPLDDAEFAEAEHDHGDAYAHEDYYQPGQRRRGGLVIVMAVLGLAVVGTAGAFAYRTTFGGSLLPALPPIIKASNTPNKITPSAGDAQAVNSSQASPTNAPSSENLVSREEEPVNIEPAKPAPRVVSTIPVNAGQNPTLPPSVVATLPPPTAAPAPAAAPSASPDWPPSPVANPPAASAASPVSAPANSAAAPPLPPAEPKKIHTVTIRPDQADGADAAAPPSASAAARSASRGAAPARSNAPDGNAPLALIPGAPEAGTPARPRKAASAPTSIASAAQANTGPAEASAAAGYAVQVSSQHSETEAQSSFQAMRAKYPGLLGKREPIIRRADLGARGIYYRALVGPFASAEEAAAMCSSLKAAGGNCLVQKN